MKSLWVVLAAAGFTCAVFQAEAVTFTLTADGVAGETWAATPAPIVPTLASNEWAYHLGDDALNLGPYHVTAAGLFAPTSVTVRALSVTNTGGSLNFDSGAFTSRPPVSITATNRITLRSYTSRAAGTGSNAARGGGLALTAPDGITVTDLIDTRGNHVSSAGDVLMNAVNGVIRVEEKIWLGGRTGNVVLAGSRIEVETIDNDRNITQTVNGNRLELTSTAGDVRAGDLLNSGNTFGGALVLRSAGGEIVAGRLTARSLIVAQASARSGGTVDVASAQGVYIWSADVSTARTNENNNRCLGGTIRIIAQDDVEVEDGLVTRVLTTSTNVVPSSAGPIGVTSVVGNILIKGLIDAHAPAGGSALGPVSLEAPNGSIVLGRVDFRRVRDVRLIAKPALGTWILGPVEGILPFLDKTLLTVGGFGEVTGNVYYQTNIAENADLDGLTYEITASSGGPFYLTPAPPAAPLVSKPSLVETNIGSSTATLGGSVDVTGGAPIAERGIYWSTNAMFLPGEGTKVAEIGSFGPGVFAMECTDLPEGARVFFRAFASNSAGIGFSGVRSFVTRPPAGTGYFVNFEGGGKTAFGPGNVTNNGVVWFFNNAATRNDPADRKVGAWGARMRWHVLSVSNGVMEMIQDKTNGVGWVTFLYAPYSADTPVAAALEYSTNGGATWAQAGKLFDTAELSALKHHAIPVFKSGDVRIRFVSKTGVNGTFINIDNIELHDYAPLDAPPPVPEPSAAVISIAGNNALLTWSDLVVDQTYRVDGATNLIMASWTNLASFSATGVSHAISVSGVTSHPTRIFRLVAE